jgi:hypothetical protein
MFLCVMMVSDNLWRKVRVVKDVISGGRLSMCGQRCRG